MISRNENVLQDRYTNHLEFKMTLWKRASILKDIRPATLFSAIHIFREKLVILYINNNTLQAAYYNKNNQLEELQQFQQDDPNYYLDFNLVHPQTYLIKDSVFFMFNYNRSSTSPVFYADLIKKKIFGFIIKSKPTLFRTNYSLSLYSDFQFFLFGGFDESMKLTNIVDSYDIIQCEFISIPAKGQAPVPRHNHLAVATSNYLIIAGGSTSTNLFDRNYLSDMFLFDITLHQWQQIKSNVPKNIGFGAHIQLNQNQILYFAEEQGYFTHYHLSLHDFQWTSLRQQKDVPPYRYQATVCLNQKENEVLVCGGFNFQKNQLLFNQLDRLQLVFKDNKERQFELYSGDMIQLDRFQRQQFFQEELNDNEQEELTFEELLEQEKQLQQQQDQQQQEQEQKKKKKNKQKKQKKR